MPPAIPIATYRLQLTADFDFDAAAAIVPYLKALGITHLYASPFMKARTGSTHGYDIVDHIQLNPELGGEAAFERLSQALKQHDLGLILDFVPNHVGVHFADNPWWLDVLEWGQASPHAVSFDIDWDMLPYRARGGVLLPIIGSSYGGRWRKARSNCVTMPTKGAFQPGISNTACPIAPKRYSEILRAVVKEAGVEDDAAGKRILDLASRYKGLRHPNRKEAPAFKAELKDIAGGADYCARAGRIPRRPGARLANAGAASSAGASALQAWAMAARLQRNQLPPLLRRQYAGRITGRGRRHIRRHSPPGQKADRGRRPAGCGSITSMACAIRAIFLRLRRLIQDAPGKRPRRFYMVVEKILGEHEKLQAFTASMQHTGL